MSTRFALAVWTLVAALGFGAIEALAVITNQPTISSILQSINAAAPIFGVSVCVVAGILLDHFFGRR